MKGIKRVKTSRRLKKTQRKRNIKTKPIFHCKLCTNSFSAESALEQHYGLHRLFEKSNSTCKEHGMTFSNVNKFITHMSKHDVKLFSCESCGESFKYFQSYKRHIKDYPFYHSFPCKKCGKVFKRAEFLEKHYCRTDEQNTVFSDAYDKESVSKSLESEDIWEMDTMVENDDSTDSGSENIPSLHLTSDDAKYEIFKCEQCEWIFTTNFNLQRHLKIYKTKHFVYPCCGMLCKRSDNILKHKCKGSDEEKENYVGPENFDLDITVENSSDVIENDCGSEAVVSEGENEEEGIQRYRCDNCPAIYFRLNSLKLHIKKFPNKHDFVCTKCKKHFTEEKYLTKHTCILEGGSKFQCSCNNYFKNMTEFRKHVGGQRPYTCCACNRKSKTITNLINHIRSHTLEKPFVCELCGKAFPVKESLVIHKKAHFNVKPYKCSTCPYSGITKWNLKLHERKHRPDDKKVREFLCTECGSAFYLKHHLRRHVKIHSNEKTNLCVFCGKLFSQASYLKMHLLKHVDGKGVRCDGCDKVLQKEDLFQHHLETGHFKYVCVPCKKVFQMKYNLERHLKNHEKLKKKNNDRYLCDLCNRTFSCKQNWHKHYQRHTNGGRDDRFYCKYCSRVFSREGNLNKHLVSHEKQNSNEPTFQS